MQRPGPDRGVIHTWLVTLQIFFMIHPELWGRFPPKLRVAYFSDGWEKTTKKFFFFKTSSFFFVFVWGGSDCHSVVGNLISIPMKSGESISGLSCAFFFFFRRVHPNHYQNPSYSHRKLPTIGIRA